MACVSDNAISIHLFDILARVVHLAREADMKVNVEVDCTPEEARRFLGLPDVSEANAVYMDALANAM